GSHRHGTQFSSIIDIDQCSCTHIDVRPGDAADITGVVPRKIATDLDYAILASETVCARTDTNIAFAIYVIACRVADGCVVAASVSGKRDRKSTRLNSSHRTISYAVFCLKKKTK